jgi:hypothetical protein
MNKDVKWLGTNDADLYGFHGAYHNGLSAVQYYNDRIVERREKYPFNLNQDVLNIGETIKDKGHYKIENFFNEDQKKLLLEIRETISNYVDNNKYIKNRDSNMAFINQPMLNIPNLYKIVFNEKLINVITSYFGCIPAITSMAVRKSFPSDSPPVSNQSFHRDYNSLVKLLKVAVYLNDVDKDTGPFTYIESSHRQMFDNWWSYHYIPDDPLKFLYGEDKIKYLTANFGDILFADTRGFHKGLKPKSKERYAMHMCFLVHPELSGDGHREESPPENWFQIRKEDYEELPENLKPVADYLKKV